MARNYTPLGLSFTVTEAQQRFELDDEEYRFLTLMAFNSIAVQLQTILAAPGSNETLLTFSGLTSSDISAAGTTTLTMISAAGVFNVRIAPGAGAGAYTNKIVLPVADRVAGQECNMLILMPASANPTLEFYSTSIATTALLTIEPDAGVARSYSLAFKFNGTAWELWDQHQIA